MERDARHMKILRNRYNQSLRSRVIYAATPKLEGRCTRRGVQRPFVVFRLFSASGRGTGGPGAEPADPAARRNPR